MTEVVRLQLGVADHPAVHLAQPPDVLTQAELARLLRLGANTISRWEAARNVQTASMDMLLRMIRDVPGTLDYLRRCAA
jgi:Helix-turn-helix